jgi:predicted nucleic acid-binding Zn ribbon protein
MLGDPDGLPVELSQAAHLHPIERRPAPEERCETILSQISLQRQLGCVHGSEILRQLLHGAQVPVAVCAETPPAATTRRSERCRWGYCSAQSIRERRVMPVWAWILIIVLLVLLLTGGIYVRR